MRTRCGVTLIGLLLVACTAQHGRWIDPSAVTVAPRAWPTPLRISPGAAPRIQALWMNETAIRTDGAWRGRIVTSTNVMSVEVRTESFTFVAQRERPGIYTFSQEILDIVPQYRRPYVLNVIARNERGAMDAWLVPITIL